MREDRATGELVAAKRDLVVAEEALAARQRDLADYEATKEDRRDRIYPPPGGTEPRSAQNAGAEIRCRRFHLPRHEHRETDERTAHGRGAVKGESV